MRIRQWLCRDNDRSELYYIFTPATCDSDTALAIAKATHGDAISSVVDEGMILQPMENQ
jgi:hypothetical protein